jgi:hypothetical protein
MTCIARNFTLNCWCVEDSRETLLSLTLREENAGQNHTRKIANNLLENVAKNGRWGRTLTSQNYKHEEVRAY